MNSAYLALQKKYEIESKDFDKKLLRIELKDCREGFVQLSQLFKRDRVRGVIANKEKAFLRTGVAESLVKSADYFSSRGYTLKIESAYRTLKEQKQKFFIRFNDMKKMFPQKTQKQLLLVANTYTAGIPILAAHTGGAAVDVLLLNREGKLLDFGTPYPHGGIESVTHFPNLSQKAKTNRKLLKEGMEKHGFKNYPFEYWHYSIGDVCAAYLTGKKFAKFGPVDFDIKRKSAVFINDNINFYKYFSL